MLVILWHFIRTTLSLAASPTSSLKNLCWSYLRRRHTNSNSSSWFYMITSAEETLQTEALKCCDCALMRSSKILFLVVRLRKTARFIQEILLPWPRWPSIPFRPQQSLLPLKFSGLRACTARKSLKDRRAGHLCLPLWFTSTQARVLHCYIFIALPAERRD